MTSNLAPPSINPSDYESLNGVIKFVLSKFLQNIDDMLPAQIVSYNRTINRAQVQILIPMVTTDSVIIQRSPLQSVPVVQIGGGGFTVNFPLKAGDVGFIKANDRDISLFLQSMKSAIPNTMRKHSFEDAVFIPAVLAGYTIASEDANNLVIQSLDNSVKISLGVGEIKIEAAAVTIVSSGGTTQFTGNLNISGDAVISGISFLGHVHSGVTPGGGDTGVPVS